MYCTLNTPKIDMDQVLCGQICPNDIVFVHRKGRRKDVEVRKSEQFLGLTIADNGYGCSYIKKIRTNSTASRVPFIQVSFSDFFFCSHFITVQCAHCIEMQCFDFFSYENEKKNFSLTYKNT